MAVYFRPLLEDALKLGLDGCKVSIAGFQEDAEGRMAVVRGPLVHIRGFVLRLEQDAIGRALMSGWLGHMAYVGCGICPFSGRRFPGSTAVRFAGYARPSLQAAGPFKGQELLVTDPRLGMSHSDHVSTDLRVFGGCTEGDEGAEDLSLNLQVGRAALVESGAVLPRDAGCHRLALPIQILPWLSYTSAFMLAPAHNILYGVVRDFFNYLLGADSGSFRLSIGVAKKVILEVGTEFVLTPEFPKPYRCILNNRGYYTMDDWLVYMDTYGPYTFLRLKEAGALPRNAMDVLIKMFGCLRRTVQHYLRPGVHTEVQRARAAADIMTYAKLAEVVSDINGGW